MRELVSVVQGLCVLIKVEFIFMKTFMKVLEVKFKILLAWLPLCTGCILWRYLSPSFKKRWQEIGFLNINFSLEKVNLE